MRPNLFTATGDPDLLTALILAHLMSPALWGLADRIRLGHPGLPSASAEPVRAIQHFVNAHFLHFRPHDAGRIWGIEERERLTDPEERETVDYTLGLIADILDRILPSEPQFIPVVPLLAQGAFPQFIYPVIDLLLAGPRALPELPHKSLGVTCCLDECLLVAALAVAIGVVRFEDFCILGSPFHYALFLFPGEKGFWINAKREYFDAATIAAAVAAEGRAGPQALFDDRIERCDRLVAPAGYCLFAAGRGTLARPHLERHAESLERLFGAPLAVSGMARAGAMAAQPVAGREAALARFAACRSAGDYEATVRAWAAGADDLLPECALLAFRHPHVRQPEIYREAALRDYHAWMRAAEVLTREDARAIVEGIPGRESVFGDSGRLAMPDEVLLFQTANERERELLEYTLLAHAPAAGK